MNCTRSQPFNPIIAICLTVLCLTTLLLTGCDQQKQTSSSKTPKNDLKKLTIGLIPEQDIFIQKKRYKPLSTET